MKKGFIGLLVLLLCALVVQAYGATGDAANVNGKAVAAISTIDGKAGSGLASICGKNYTDGDVVADSCTGGLLFSWHCENVDVTVGTPTGCSAGDTTATANSSAAINNDHTAQDGSNHCDFPTASDRYLFDISSNDIATTAAGTVIFYVKFQTITAYMGLFRIYGDADDYISVTVNATADEAYLSYAGQGGSTRSAVTGAANMTTGVWYKITAKWSVAGVDESGTKYLSIDVDDTNRGYGTSAVTAFTNAAVSLQIGETGGVSSDAQIDNIKVYNSWLTTP